MSKLANTAVNLAKNAIAAATPQVKVMMRYAKVEMAPPKLSELPAIRSGIGQLLHSAKTRSYRDLTVREAWLNTLVFIEIYCWFYVGECIGKRHLIGYDV